MGATPKSDAQLILRALGAAGRAGVSKGSGLRGRDEAALRPCSAAGWVVGPPHPRDAQTPLVLTHGVHCCWVATNKE